MRNEHVFLDFDFWSLDRHNKSLTIDTVSAYLISTSTSIATIFAVFVQRFSLLRNILSSGSVETFTEIDEWIHINGKMSLIRTETVLKKKILMAFFQQNETVCPFPHVSRNKVHSDDQMAKCIH